MNAASRFCLTLSLSAAAPSVVCAQARIVTAPGKQAFDHIDSTWWKPAIKESTIKVQGSKSCGPVGDGGDTLTNMRKDRADTPDSSYLVTVDAIRSLNDTVLWRHGDEKPRDEWTGQDSAVVTPYEGIPLTVVGYFAIVKPQKKSAPKSGKKVGESTNCHSWSERDTDWHISLVAAPTEEEEEGVVVEPTPRSKRRNPQWTADAAKSIAVRETPSSEPDEENASQVRVTGFLMLDPAHVSHIRGSCQGSKCASKTFYRATLWELHPVTQIEVNVNGHWVKLSDQ